MISRRDSEFSRVVDCANLGTEALTLSIEAEAGERAALAERLGLSTIGSLAADVTIGRRSDGLVELRGLLRATLEQICVITLEPVPTVVEEPFSLLYSSAAATEHDHGTGEMVLSPFDDEVWPEPLVDDRLDVGEAVAQQLVVALDPYPRAPGAEFTGYQTEPGGDVSPGEVNPFRDLGKLLDKP